MTASGRVVIAALLALTLMVGVPPWHYCTAVLIHRIHKGKGQWTQAL